MKKFPNKNIFKSNPQDHHRSMNQIKDFKIKHSDVIRRMGSGEKITAQEAKDYNTARGQLQIAGSIPKNEIPIEAGPVHIQRDLNPQESTYSRKEPSQEKNYNIPSTTVKYNAGQISSVETHGPDNPPPEVKEKLQNPKNYGIDSKNPEHIKTVENLKNFRDKHKEIISSLDTGSEITPEQYSTYKQDYESVVIPKGLERLGEVGKPHPDKFKISKPKGHFGKSLEHPHDKGNSSTLSELLQIAHHIEEITQNMSPSDLPDWLDSKISKASQLLSDASHYLEYDQLEKAKKPFKGYNPKKHAKTGGLNETERKRINREEGRNLKAPVTGKPKPGSKDAKRRASFCARMSGVDGPTSKDGQLTPKGAALKRWNCSKSLTKSEEKERAAKFKKMCHLKKYDKIEGGLADKNKPEDFDQKQLEIGIKVETEHTKDPKIAQEIAMDHLKEDPQYYTKLQEVEKIRCWKGYKPTPGKQPYDKGSCMKKALSALATLGARIGAVTKPKEESQ